MYIEIEDRKYYFYNQFPESNSKLKRLKEIDLEILYLRDRSPFNSNLAKEIEEELEYLKNLDKLPEFVYITNNYYFWIFKNCKIISKTIKEDNTHVSFARVVVKLKLNYDEVFGTNKRSVFERDIKLQELLK